MRDDLRRTADEIWVIDCSPEGHQPNVPTRIFQGVQQPVCIVLAARTTATDPTKPARVRFRALPLGTRAEKFAALQTIGLDNAGWVDCSDDWRGPFLPAAVGAWATYPALDDLFIDNGAGVMPGRTWVIAPDAGSLIKRWNVLVKEKDADKKAALFHPHLRGGKPGDKHVNKTAEVGLAGHEHRKIAVSGDKGAPVKPMPYAFRSFDRQWIIPDSRLINQPNPSLWNGHSKKQVYLTALDHPAATSGPAVTLTSLIPDLHHFKGSFGGRVYRLYADSAGTLCEVSPAIIKLLSDTYGRPIVGDEVMAYVAAIAACPAYTERFRGDLVSPPLRIPFPVDAKLFVNAVAVGREVIWVQAFGERFTDPVAGRPASRPRLPKKEEPTIPAGGAIPGDAASMPNEMEYDKTARRLRIGNGGKGEKIGMAAITVAALLSLSHARADDITGDILHEDCIVASHGSGSDRDCDIYINGLAAGVLVDQVAREQGTPIYLMAVSTQRQRKSISDLVPSSADHSISPTRLRARPTLAAIISRTSPGSFCSLYFMWSGEVEINKWMRGRSAGRTASAQRSISFAAARASPATLARFIRLAIAKTASKSPSEVTGKPASIISTPIVSRRPATCSFSSKVIEAPGDCSPSRRVVSKMTTDCEFCRAGAAGEAVSRLVMVFVRSKLASKACRLPLSAQAHRPAGPQGRISRSNPE
jgi:hypothetical protein